MEGAKLPDWTESRAGPALMPAARRRSRVRPRTEPAAGLRSPVGGWPIAAALVVAAVMLYAIRYALLPFVFAMTIAFVVDPVVVALTRYPGMPRWLAACLLYVFVAGALGAIVYWFGVEVASDMTTLLNHGEQTATELVTRLFGPDGVTLFGQTYPPQEAVMRAGQALAGMLGPGVFARTLGAALFVTLAFFMLLVLVPYFMVSGPRLAAGAIWLIPPERRHSVERVLPRIIPVLRRYLVGVLAVVSYTSLAAWIGFGLVFHLPSAPLLAITVGLLEIIPAIGPVTAAVLAALAAFEHGGGLTGMAGPIAFIIALRLSIDNLVGPLVLGQAARVHPVVVMFAFVCGAALFGAIGLLLAVPAAVTLKITLQHYYAEPIVKTGPAAAPK